MEQPPVSAEDRKRKADADDAGASAPANVATTPVAAVPEAPLAKEARTSSSTEMKKRAAGEGAEEDDGDSDGGDDGDALDDELGDGAAPVPAGAKEPTAAEKQASITNPADEAARHKPRLTVHGLPPKWTQKKYLRMLKEKGIVYEKARKIPNVVYGMLSFTDAASRDAACVKLKEAGYKPAEPNHQRMGVNEMQHQTREGGPRPEKPRPSGGGEEGENAALVDETTLKTRTARSVVTPWADMPYETQLSKKAEEARHVLLEITKVALKDSSYNVPLWLKALKGLPICPLENDSVYASPRTVGYRNKIGWTIGYDYLMRPVIGHLLGQTKEGIIAVGDPADCPNVPPLSEALRLVFHDFMMKSGYMPWHKLNHKGVWRTLTLRTTESGDAMVILQACCAEVQDIPALKTSLKEFMVAEAAAKKLSLKSLYFQDYRGVSNSAPPDLPFELLYGDDVITETLLGLKFRISPNSFFQVNTKAAELLYSLVARWCNPNNEPTTVMDIYCGTGSIGLSVARSVREVCGIEIVDAAVLDAKANAKLNGIENTAFFAGKAEELLGKKLWDWCKRSPNFVGIVDPPRAGLHLEAIRSIRACKPMKRLIYVSCNQKELVKNAATLCRAESNTLRGLPFRPVMAVAVDLFPHTEHCEMIMLFERTEGVERPDTGSHKKHKGGDEK